jgi:hypothetical protein
MGRQRHGPLHAPLVAHRSRQKQLDAEVTRWRTVSSAINRVLGEA